MNECFKLIFKLFKSTLKSLTIKTPFIDFTFAPLHFTARLFWLFF